MFCGMEWKFGEHRASLPSVEYAPFFQTICFLETGLLPSSNPALRCTLDSGHSVLVADLGLDLDLTNFLADSILCHSGTH